MKTRQVGVEMFHANERTDTHYEANSLFFAILRTRLRTTLRIRTNRRRIPDLQGRVK